MKLYTYYRSSASYRVRIALALKSIAYTTASINLLEVGQKTPEYLAQNPQGLIPALEIGRGQVISQSGAIIEWLEETFPMPALLPTDPFSKAEVRSLVNHIACDVHPLNNLSVQQYLARNLNASAEQVTAWYSHWVQRGFNSIELIARKGNGLYCIGDHPGMADCYLIPQVYNALRFHVDTNAYPAIMSVYEHCNTLEPFRQAHPDQQPDTPA
jgi:maleylacetoacetate isomerase